MKDIVKGPVTTEVTVMINGGVDVVATLSSRSADTLGLTTGSPRT